MFPTPRNRFSARIRKIPLALFALGLSSVFGSSSNAGDYLVDLNYVGPEGAPSGNYTGAYSSIVAALSDSSGTAVPAGSSPTSPNRIFFTPGTYNTAFATSTSLVNSKSNIALLSTTNNPDDVVITSTLFSPYNTGSGTIGTTGSSSLQLKGNNTTAIGITFANSSPTPQMIAMNQAIDPQGNFVPSQPTGGGQAVALKLTGDQQAFVNTKFLGYQDTLYVDGDRAYFENVYVTGTVDFIFGQGTGVFKNATINLGNDHSGDTITAARTDKRTSNGLVFLDSELTAESVQGNPVIDPAGFANPNGETPGDRWLGRPWGWQSPQADASTVWINTTMGDSIRALGWLNWNSSEVLPNPNNGGDPGRDTRYAEFNSKDAGGNPLDASGRIFWSHQLTASQASDYSVENVFSPEADFAWYGLGYTGSDDPNDPNFSWPAFWGDRNADNDLGTAIVKGNPDAYSNPSWRIAGGWDPTAQILAASVPEPATCCLLGIGVVTLATTRAKQRSR